MDCDALEKRLRRSYDLEIHAMVAEAIAAIADLRARNEALEKAIGSVMPFIATQSIGCHGEKCREPWCHSCWGEDAAEEAAMAGLVAKRRAEAALAANKEK